MREGVLARPSHPAPRTATPGPPASASVGSLSLPSFSPLGVPCLLPCLSCSLRRSCPLGFDLASPILFAPSRFRTRSLLRASASSFEPRRLPRPFFPRSFSALSLALLQSLTTLVIAPSMFPDPFLGAHCSLISAALFPGFIGGKPEVEPRRRSAAARIGILEIAGRFSQDGRPDVRDDPPAATPAPRKTPLYEAHRRAGAKIIDFGGWFMPVSYAIGDHRRAPRDALGRRRLRRLPHGRGPLSRAARRRGGAAPGDQRRREARRRPRALHRRLPPHGWHRRRPHRLPHHRRALPDRRQRRQPREGRRLVPRERRHLVRDRRRLRRHGAHRVPGSAGRGRAADADVDAAVVGALVRRRPRARRRRRPARRSRAPATPPRTASRSSARRATRIASGTACSRPRPPSAASRSASARATRCGSRASSLSTATT